MIELIQAIYWLFTNRKLNCMTAVTLIFPHQLFANHPSIVRGQDVYLIEEYLFFKQYRFHQQKLVLYTGPA